MEWFVENAKEPFREIVVDKTLLIVWNNLFYIFNKKSSTLDIDYFHIESFLDIGLNA